MYDYIDNNNLIEACTLKEGDKILIRLDGIFGFIPTSVTHQLGRSVSTSGPLHGCADIESHEMVYLLTEEQYECALEDWK